MFNLQSQPAQSYQMNVAAPYTTFSELIPPFKQTRPKADRFSTPPNSSAGQLRRLHRITTQLDKSPVVGEAFISSDEDSDASPRQLDGRRVLNKSMQATPEKKGKGKQKQVRNLGLKRIIKRQDLQQKTP